MSSSARAVGSIPPVVRTNSASEQALRSRSSALLIAGCDRPATLAARDTLRSA